MNVFFFVLCLIGLILAFVYKMATMGIRRNDEAYNDDETALIQELNRSMVRMEQRIEALETLLVEGNEKKRPPTYEEVMQAKQQADQ
jgi:phage shock protein B